MNRPPPEGLVTRQLSLRYSVPTSRANRCHRITTLQPQPAKTSQRRTTTVPSVICPNSSRSQLWRWRSPAVLSLSPPSPLSSLVLHLPGIYSPPPSPAYAGRPWGRRPELPYPLAIPLIILSRSSLLIPPAVTSLEDLSPVFSPQDIPIGRPAAGPVIAGLAVMRWRQVCSRMPSPPPTGDIGYPSHRGMCHDW